MTRIKICGITNRDDARAACEYGADALGFIFVPGSPRCVGADSAQALLRGVPPLVWRIGVYDALPSSAARELHAIQYYSNEAAAAACPAPVAIKAFRVRDESSLAEMEAYVGPMDMLLLDAYSPHALGGTGHTFNWGLATAAKRLGLPIILAGGLTPDNVADAVAAARPYAVDVASGVEAEPGRKDHEKMRRFIRAVRAADLALGG